jgi:uncharacterized repeat protein (TIGR01451 family)
VLLDETVGTLAAGQSKTATLTVSARRGGDLTVQATASGTGGLIALPEMATVTVHEPELTVSLHGPGRGYVGQELTWKLVVRNVGDVPLRGVELRADLPAEVRLIKATQGGRSSGRQVAWDLGTAPPRQERTVEVTAVCERLTDRAAVRATAAAAPAAEAGGASRPPSKARRVGPDRPVESPLEILGIPALQLSVKDAKDPIATGERTTYTVRVRNAGTVAARSVEVTAEVPKNLRPVRATGPGPAGRIEEERVAFPAVETLAPNAEASFVIEVEGRIPGDARLRVEARSALLTQPLRAEEPTRVLGQEPPSSGK